MLSHAELLQMKRWNTPTIYNGWEQITRRDAAHEGFNLEEVRDFMPHMGPMVGYAVTLTIEPSNASHRTKSTAFLDYFRYVASVPHPKVVVVQDLDKPQVLGSFWGEVTANIHRALGCVGTITDGAIRDLDEMNSAGFKALARRLCVGHAHAAPVRWGCEVEIFGRKIKPAQLIHGDKHGFLVIPSEDEDRLLESACFMDANECQTLIAAARSSGRASLDEILQAIEQAMSEFGAAVLQKFGRKGEV